MKQFISATHMGMGSTPSLGSGGAYPVPKPSTAKASLPRRSILTAAEKAVVEFIRVNYAAFYETQD